MSDESQLQITPKDSDSSLNLLKARSGLIARGRHDAAILSCPLDLEPTDPLSEIRRLAEEGDTQAQWKLGDAYSRGKGVRQDDAEAVTWFRQAIGPDFELVFVGYSYYDGRIVDQNVRVPKDYTEAVKWLRKGIPSEFAAAEVCLSKCYFYGRGVQQDYAEALEWLFKALHGEISSDDDDVGGLLGRIYALGLSDVRQQPVKVRQWHGPASTYSEDAKADREGAESGSDWCQFHLGLAYAYGRGVAQDDTEAAMWFRRAADSGNLDAQFHLGLSYAFGRGVQQDDVQAYFWIDLASLAHSRKRRFRKPEHRGEYQLTISSALATIAARIAPEQIIRTHHSSVVLYCCQNSDGDEVPGDWEQYITTGDERVRTPLYCWRTAAEQGHSTGQRKLGSCYATGFGVPLDYVEAARWFRKAADQGNSRAQHDLGVLYSHGNGVPRDHAEAAKWFRKAADQGNPRAQCDLGILYSDGSGVPEDHAEAAKWFRKAANQGYAHGQTLLQRLHDEGKAVPIQCSNDDSNHGSSRVPVIDLMKALQKSLDGSKGRR